VADPETTTTEMTVPTTIAPSTTSTLPTLVPTTTTALADGVFVGADGAVKDEGPPAEVLYADLLSDVYHQAMIVVEHPTRGCPLVLIADSV
jgi:ABC-type cobalamin/Fe3+-siderophores transport system ATPase subunit